MKIDNNLVLFITSPFIYFSINVLLSSIYINIFPIFNMSLIINTILGIYYIIKIELFVAYLSIICLSFIWIVSFLFFIIITNSIIYSLCTLIFFSIILIKFGNIQKLELLLFIPKLINFFLISYNLFPKRMYYIKNIV